MVILKINERAIERGKGEARVGSTSFRRGADSTRNGGASMRPLVGCAIERVALHACGVETARVERVSTHGDHEQDLGQRRQLARSGIRRSESGAGQLRGFQGCTIQNIIVTVADFQASRRLQQDLEKTSNERVKAPFQLKVTCPWITNPTETIPNQPL